LAIVLARDQILRGPDSVVLAGGVDELSEFKLAGHGLLGTLSRTGQSRPFARDRDGTYLSQGAGFVVLERTEHCLARGHVPLAILAGHGVACDTDSLTSPRDDGEGAATAMAIALEDASLSPGQIDHIQAHGTGTLLNDAAEAKAIQAVFGRVGDSLTISADKGAAGHTLGASGALSLIAVVTMMRYGLVPPIVGCHEADDRFGLPFVVGEARERRISRALVNAFGFGGANVSIAIQDHPD
jgi:3-oxoacyl-[acyl-carrier-protein] synthase II